MTITLEKFISQLDESGVISAVEITAFQQSQSPAAESAEDLGKLLGAIYQFQVGTGMVYMGAKGVPETLGESHTLVQSIKLPRDVIQGNSATCIELTILMSALLNQCGVKSHMVLIPGHAFPVIQTPDGQLVAFECTGIGGQAIGGVSSFEDAFKNGNATWEKCMKGETPFVLVDYQAHQASGLRPPELEAVDITALMQMLSDRIARRTAAAKEAQKQQQQADAQQQAQPGPGPAPGPTPAPGPAPGPDPAVANFAAYRDPTGQMAVRYPANWMTDANAIAMVQQSGAPWYLYGAADMQTGWELSVFGFDTPDQNACTQAIQGLGFQMGVDMQIGTAQLVQIQGRPWTVVPFSYVDMNGVPYTSQLYMHTIGQLTYGFGVGGPTQTAGLASGNVNLIIQNVVIGGQ